MKIEAPENLAACTALELDALSRQVRSLDIAVQVEIARRGVIDLEESNRARYAAMKPSARGVVGFLEGSKWRMAAIAIGIAALMNAESCARFARAAIERVAAEEARLRQQQEAKP